MWRARLIGITACVAALGLCGPVTASAHDDPERDDRAEEHAVSGDATFTRDLDPYGDWVWEPAHGRVWRPRVDGDWRPYWRGHWSWRGDWVWVSADPWGDVPFHYGDWTWSARFGWVWIPGAVWSPARVTWIVDGPVIAWAPAGLQITIGSTPRFWVYADREHFTRGIVRPHRLPPPRGHFHGRTVIRDINRVIVPNRPVGRVFRDEPRRERTVTVGGERRLVSPRDDRPNRRLSFESTRGSGRGMGAARGFERRDAR